MNDTHIETAAGVAMPRLIYGTAWKQDRTADLGENAGECLKVGALQLYPTTGRITDGTANSS